MELKELREKAGFTQFELAKALGYSTPQFISNIERGRARIPKRHYRVFASLLMVPAEALIDIEVEHTRRLLHRAFRIKAVRNV